jgi:hypothetical protein
VVNEMGALRNGGGTGAAGLFETVH